MKKFFWAIQAAVFYLLTLFAALIPVALAYRFGAFAGLMIPVLVPKRRAIAIDNISRALPFLKAHPLWKSEYETTDELAQETFKNLGRSLMEICRLYHGRGDEIINNIEVRGRENYEAAKAKGKGLILFSGHCGNWELMALAFSSIFGEGWVVARRQNNPYLNRMVERMRIRYKNSVIYKQGALRGILKALKNRGHIGLLADQTVFPEEGALIEIMGRKAWASKAPVIMIQKSAAALVPTFIHREGERHIITFYPQHDFSGDMSEEGIRNETQALSRYIENFVVAHPTQWYWVHRRWKRNGENQS
ncbi:MAG TPA: lysophospholipid acyltransferase family protein [Desulfuromonadaceae bacterium]|jgi:KDO2-lipid IV(A) lauroyltransferase